MQLNERMTNTEVMKEHLELMNMEWTDLDDFERKWGSRGNIEAAAKRFNLWWRLDFVGDLLQRDLVDREWLYKHFSTVVLMQWFKWEPIIKQARKMLKDPEYVASFEYLARELTKMDEQKGIKRKNPNTLTYKDAHLGKIEPG